MGVRITVQSLWPTTKASSFVYEFAQARVVIGRSRSADVQLPHAAVSGTHATIRAEGSGYAVVDEGSTNGTRVNETPLVAGRPRKLQAHDLIDLGGYRLSIEVGVPVAQTMSARLAANFARQMLEEQAEPKTASELEDTLASIQEGSDERVDLLPIAKEVPSEAPRRESRPSRSRSSEPTGRGTSGPPQRLGRGELAVYVLAALLVLASIVTMVLLMRS